MGREKLKRHLQFIPIYKEFGAKGYRGKETIYLLHEEMEALYLIDNQGLYQAEAAERMGISRPTFARILGSARQKVCMMLISGANLTLENEKDEYVLMIPSMHNERLEPGKPDAPFLMLYKVYEHRIVEKEVLDNPVFVEDKRPGQVLPKFCVDHHVNFFVAAQIGKGLKSALLSKGIYAATKKDFSEDEIVNREFL
jgi:predicted DNA-binding protein (UPF0251 family)/predicted Fe-Mo cluster-binding NifX family protein